MFVFSLALAVAPPPIVHGEVTHDYPEVVLLYAADASGSLASSCTGTVIAPAWVLTAAHCLVDTTEFRVDQVYVLFVDRFSEASGSNSAVATRWVMHPDYRESTAEHDVGLVEFSGEGASVALYDTAPAAADEGRDYTIVGFGATSESDTSTELTKRVAHVPLDDFDGSFYYTEDNVQNACSGDSGGPLFRVSAIDGSYALAGVMNWVTACSGGSLASARIDQQLDFIEGYVVPTYADAYADGPGLRPADEAEGSDTKAVEPNPVACGFAASVGWLGVVGAFAMAGARRDRTVSYRTVSARCQVM